MIATLTTIVPMEELALIKMTTTLAAASHLGLECTVNVSHEYSCSCVQ